MDRVNSKVPRLLRWRNLRWVATAAVLPALWACNSNRLAVPSPSPAIIDSRKFVQSVNHKLDLLFMVDNSQSMMPLQAKMAAQLGSFMDALVDPTTHLLPDLHVAVISSSFGGGAWSNVNQCGAGSHPGDDRGFFQQGPGGAGNGSCSMLNSGATYLANGDGNTPANFTGDIRDAFKCIALLGDTGCGFESQFESTYYALYYANQAYGTDKDQNTQNGGFLRTDAVLAIVMLTNEDDCSVSGESLLLNPAVNSVMDPTGLGALWSYRCNEFGHLCDGQPPPHDPPPMGGVVLNNCVSAENMGKTDDKVTDPDGNPDKTKGHLWPTVQEFSDYVRSFKSNPDDILVAAIAGPVTPYKVVPQVNNAAMGEVDPAIDHSCTQGGGGDEYADPAVRIKQWVDTFGPNGVFYPICADTLNKAMVGIADKIHQKLGASCISSKIAWRDEGNHSLGHNCQVSQKTVDKNTNKTTTIDLPECNDAISNTPCFSLTFDSNQCTTATAKTLFKVCNESTCMAMMSTSSDEKNATIACAVE
ncbi:MAG TPA: hypothetical protein VHU40_04170 [Polyangia bacterium]|nr:hypothetical protein [Polyangia bacterium]